MGYGIIPIRPLCEFKTKLGYFEEGEAWMEKENKRTTIAYEY